LSGEIPAAAQGVYQEKSFSSAKVNVVYMMAWASLSQFIILLLLVPLNFIPGFGGIPPSEFMGTMKDAALCFAQTEQAAEECKGAVLWLMLSMISMLLAQFFQALVIKISTATLSVLLLTAIVPLSAIMFTFDFTTGGNAESFTPYTYASLFLVVGGILIYRFLKRDNKYIVMVFGEEKQEEDKPLMGDEEEEGEKRRERTLSTRVGMIDVEVYNQDSDQEVSENPASDVLYENTIPLSPPHDEETGDGSDF